MPDVYLFWGKTIAFKWTGVRCLIFMAASSWGGAPETECLHVELGGEKHDQSRSWLKC